MVGMLPLDLEHARALWRDLTDAPNGFTPNTIVVVGSDTHRASPSGWIGIVELAGDVVVACPVAAVERVRRILSDSDPDQILQPRDVDALLHPVETLGPALLFYGRPTMTARSIQGKVIGPIDATDPRVRAVIEDASPADCVEAGLEDVTSGAYVGVADDGTPASVCAWTEWPHGIAHMSALTASSYRGKGFGTATAVEALAAADAHGLLPQWRAAHWNHASIAVARRLGLGLLGHQYSLALA